MREKVWFNICMVGFSDDGLKVGFLETNGWEPQSLLDFKEAASRMNKLRSQGVKVLETVSGGPLWDAWRNGEPIDESIVRAQAQHYLSLCEEVKREFNRSACRQYPNIKDKSKYAEVR